MITIETIIKSDMNIDLNAKGTLLKIQNISNILSNFKGTIVLNRDMGLHQSILDNPILRNFQIPKLKEQIEKYCDVEVVEVSFENENEKIIPKVRVIL